MILIIMTIKMIIMILKIMLMIIKIRITDDNHDHHGYDHQVDLLRTETEQLQETRRQLENAVAQTKRPLRVGNIHNIIKIRSERPLRV